MNKIPFTECASSLEDFSIQDRALDCPTCLRFQVNCLGNYHPKQAQGNFPILKYIHKIPHGVLYFVIVFVFLMALGDIFFLTGITRENICLADVKTVAKEIYMEIHNAEKEETLANVKTVAKEIYMEILNAEKEKNEDIFRGHQRLIINPPVLK